MLMAELHEGKCTAQTSALKISTHIPLAKVSHMDEPNAKRQDVHYEDVTMVWVSKGITEE